ncbi:MULTISPECIES: monovalent cation/H+ antiporter subunit D [Nitrosomonas]|uniref:Multisubunit potassium/proton antiporter PhaD subunit n=2 Tax=Nitrosomonas eutropha TaxID=916 RepID=A0ABX5M7A7_9PROT|nr:MULTISPECIES: monovalent cation/H+ antiporter subunit D [Nitrosomonas]ABI59940.1 multisubunit potassium/proton antiporter, PhaD subunit [Nitrosomonas eutropha C91]MXS79319.1 monovalent cation/H+ antiporter subunit D [Nitrosomonas sp. GH22]PXV81605.1 multisubunit potassium/proton antiporter PhaD subunit [Nitrosomonas eutropha]SEJ09879.1 multisubunit potassium/proton antiporter, PhaD subunit [Nitrosomonas eutropha]
MKLSPEHLVIAPILIPLIAGALQLFLDDRGRKLKASLSILSTVALLAISVLLLRFTHTDDEASGGKIAVYLLGNWPPPFAINLVLDRLSAMMLALTATLALPTLIFSMGRWHKAGVHFHTLFLLLLMGLNGAFLTGDLFNLFVFFEVMLAASYGLVLHGSGLLRVKAGLHYIAINLVASLLFLIGVALIYGVTGTLNMADLAIRIPQINETNQTMLESGAAILSVAFLIKAGMWPLSFWLPETYAVAPAPSAAIFAIMSKVGIYVLLRLALLFFGSDPGFSEGPGAQILLYGGLATIGFGTVGVLASQTLGRFAGFSVLISSGTLLASMGLVQAEVTAGALFYLVSSTLAISALFMLIELVERGQNLAASVLAVTMEAFGYQDEEIENEEIVGVAIPRTIAVLGTCFAACAILLVGLPPLSGFIAKFVILSAIFSPDIASQIDIIPATSWWFMALLILSGLATLIAMSRSGIHAFWAPSVDTTLPRVLFIEIIPVAVLLCTTLVLTIQAGPVMRFMEATAISLHAPQPYIEGVMNAPTMLPPPMEVVE